MEKFEKKIVEEIMHDLKIIQARVDNIDYGNISLEDAVSCIDDAIIDLKDYIS